MSALIGLGMLMHGLTGYENRNQRIKADERQDKLDAAQAARDAQSAERQTWAREDADAQRRAREDRQAIDRAIAEGGKAGTMQDAGAVSYTDAAGAKKTAYQPDLPTAQFAAEQQRLEEADSAARQQLSGDGSATPAPPSNPVAEQAASVRTLGGARRLFSGLTAASDAKKFADENPVTPYAKYMALSERLSTMAGGQEKADAYLKRAKDAEKEGAFRALNMLDAGDADGALNAWNSTGAKRLEAGQKFVTMTDKAGNKTHQVVNSDGSVAVPNVEQAMLRYLSGIEGVAKQAEARANTRAKVQEELFKPRVLKPGEKFGALDPADGKWKEFAEGAIPAGYEVMTDPQGNTVLRKLDGGGRGAGAGAGGKAAKADIDVASEILKDGLGKSDGTPEGAQRYTRAVSYLDGIYAGNPGITPRTAAAIAADASADPTKVTLQLDHRSGMVGKVYRNPDFDSGRAYNLAPSGATVAEMEKSVGTKGMQSAVVGMIENMVATLPEEQRGAAKQQLVVLAAAPAERKAFLDASREAGKDVAALQRQLDLIGKYVPAPQDKPAARPTMSFTGGLDYNPAPGSPSAQFAERQARLKAEGVAKERERAAAQQALSKQFQADKAAMKPEDFVRKYEATRAQLPAADAAELNRIWSSVR